MDLLEIEKELAGEKGIEAMERHDRVLLLLGERLREAIGKGLPPDEFRRCEALGEAVTVARKLLRLQVRERHPEGAV